MRCTKCGNIINDLNHYYVPVKGATNGKRVCINCAKEQKIVTLV